jgi:radical SAM superfamily enzyme YgiQ (UPF0313 family)
LKDLTEAGTRCLLIQPKISEYSSLNYIEVCKFVGAKYSTPPLGLLTVAALLPQNWEFKLIDANVEPILDEHYEWADIVCSGGILSQQLEIFSILEKVHSFGKKVLLGGPEPSSQPNYYLAADYLIMGEGEDTIPLFLEDLKNGSKRGRYTVNEFTDMREAVVPRFDLIDHRDYLMMGIQFSRGCPYNCEFCNVVELFGRKFRTKTIQQVITELQVLYNLGYRGRIFFVDDNFFGDKRSVLELLKKIRKWSQKRNYPFYFAAEVTINMAEDDEILKLAKEADLRYFSIGLETPDNDILLSIQKTQNTNKQISQVIKKIYSYGIAVDTSFILGFDGEHEKTADNMINCIQEAGICMAMIGTLYALPNTRLAERLQKEDRLINKGKLQKDYITDIDQMTSGLNFLTLRSKKIIFMDFIKVLQKIYDPVNYYKRLLYTGINLKCDYKYKPDLKKTIRNFKAFLRICVECGLKRKTGLIYWRTFFTVLFRNPRALEVIVSFAAMYIHLSKHSQFIISLMKERIHNISEFNDKDISSV